MRVWLALCLPLLALACGDNQYAQAGAGAAVAVAAAGLNRALTDDCWARCQQGELCNHKSGLCERGECTPPCGAGTHCARSRSGSFVCEPDPGTLGYGRSPRPPRSRTPPDAGPSDGSAPDAATSPR